MKLARFEHGGGIFFGIVKGEEVAVIKGDMWDSYEETGQSFPVSGVKFLPFSSPSKIVCIGLNYLEHIKEIGRTELEIPHFFLKPPSCLIGHHDAIVIPSGAERVDYEGELAAVIRKQARNITPDKALDHVLGYCCFNDVTNRALVSKDQGFLTEAKGYDTFGAMGPVVETDADPGNLHIMTRVNGNILQDDNTGNCLFSLTAVISHISRCMTLLPGDIVSTGTPKGVSPLNPGDVVEVEIEGIGILSNPVAAEEN